MEEEPENKGNGDSILTPPTVLVVEDDEGLLRLIQKSLRRAGFHTEGVLSGAGALDWMANNPATLLLLDYRLPDMTGEQVIKSLAKQQSSVPFMVITGHGDERIAVEMMKRGARDYLVKDSTLLDRLPQVVERTIEQLATEKKLAEAEKELTAAEEYARLLIDSSLDMIISVDQDRRIVELNLAAQKTFGYGKAEVLGKHVDILYADPTEGSKAHEAARRAGRFTGEILNKRKNGETFPSFLAASAIKDEQGKFLGVMGVSRDITERKRAEEDAARRHRELTALHNVLMSITQTLDLEEVLREIVSQAGTALAAAYTSIVTVNQDGSLGIDSEDFQSIPPLSVRARPEGVTARIIESGQPVVIDDVDADVITNPALVAPGIKSFAGMPIKTKDATIGVLFVHSRERNAFLDRLGLLMDFASQAAIAIENARLYQEASTVGALREADRLKTELLANVSHELRTPLASIKGYCTSVLRFYDRLSDEDKRDSLHEINQASDRLTELIENLLQLSRLEAAGLHAEKEPTRIESLISSAVEDMEEKAKEHHFVAHVEKPLPVVQADPGRIRQVLDNLLSNAVKYSSEGTEISVQCESKGQELVVSVRDQGIGIAPQEIDNVFDRFYQVTPGLCQRGGGAGLGLAICKRIVEAHRGRIWVESTPGQGSTFTFSLPLMPDKSGDKGQ